jgi:hypothetical protein
VSSVFTSFADGVMVCLVFRRYRGALEVRAYEEANEEAGEREEVDDVEPDRK